MAYIFMYQIALLTTSVLPRYAQDIIGLALGIKKNSNYFFS